MHTKVKLILATVGLSTAVAAGIAGPAYAAASDHPTGTASAPSAAPSTGGGTGATADRGAHRCGSGPKFEQDLATQLGVPTQKVTAAVTALRTEQRAAHEKGSSATRAQLADEFASKLAAKLGLDPTKVRDAMHTVRAKEHADRQAQLKGRLDKAVKAGKISQSDADASLRVLKSGVLAPAAK
jgi:hypothetical protein